MTRGWVRVLFWSGLVALLVLAVHLLKSILLPFVLGTAIAFLLDPLVDRLDRWRIPRALSALAVLLGFILLIVALLLLLVPLLEAQVSQLVDRFPRYLEAGRHLFDRLFQMANDRLPAEDVERLRDAAGNKLGDLLAGLGNVVTSLLTGGVAVANVLSLVFITPIVTFFLLRDWNRIVATVDSWLPRQHLATIREQARLIQETLSGFLRGQAMVCLLFGCVYAAGLSLLGLDFGLVIGFCTGLMIFIPFLGGITGASIATALAFAQFPDWHRPLQVALLFAAGQTLEGNVVTPKLVGDRVHLHPLWVIFSLLAFGALFGFVGVLIAVPMAAVLGVLTRFALKRYLLSPLYDPLNGPPSDGAIAP